MREYVFRLQGMDSPPGQIRAADLTGVTDAVKTLVYRLTREAAARPGMGRADAAVEALAQVRVGMSTGSTRLHFHVGDGNALEVDPLAEGVDDELWRLLHGLQVNERPETVSMTIAEAVGDLGAAIRRAAPVAVVAVPRRAPLTLLTATIDPQIWRGEVPDPVLNRAVEGELEMVDLHSAKFRVRDAAGNAIDLIDVQHPTIAARLVGHLVAARGVLYVGQGAGHHRLLRALIEPREDPLRRLGVSPPGTPDVQALADAARALGPVEPMALTDAELEDFLAEIRG